MTKYKRIEAKSPTRVDLAGGTLDLWPLYLFHKDCVTVNLAIDIMTRVTLIPRKDDKIILSSADTKTEHVYKNIKAVPEGKGHDLHLLRVHVEFWKPHTGFELHTQSESPIGAGIAASSSLNISLCGAFSKLTERKLTVEETVTLAGNLEARVIHTPTGCQDYFPALFGGLNLIELTPLGPRRQGLEMDFNEFQMHFVLVYTGRPHHSGLNNWEIFKDHIDGSKQTYKSFDALRQVSNKMWDACQNKKWKRLGSLFDDEFKARVGLSKVFTSPEIERLRKVALKAGAEALKICGAGGGGCVFLWCPTSKRDHVEKACQQSGFQVLAAKPTRAGLEIKTS
ncbi:MAG: galactokinase [Oligoflexia bacterium]|nr:galactokinase [Oligoflexia bacterium]